MTVLYTYQSCSMLFLFYPIKHHFFLTFKFLTIISSKFSFSADFFKWEHFCLSGVSIWKKWVFYFSFAFLQKLSENEKFFSGSVNLFMTTFSCGGAFCYNFKIYQALRYPGQVADTESLNLILYWHYSMTSIETPPFFNFILYCWYFTLMLSYHVT